MNVVEYALQLRDNASGSIFRITERMRENIRVSRQMRQASHEAGKGIGQALDFGKLFKGGAIMAAAAAAGSAAAGLFADSAQSALDRQQVQVSFNVLAGGEAMGRQLTDQLVALQRDTILGSEVFRNAQTMMGFGFDSTEVADNLKMLGDVSMGNSERLGALTLAFSQVRAAGRLTGQDLLQFINAGFNPLQQISESTGKSIAALKDEMSNGLVSFDMVQQAFRDATGEGGRFDNMLARIAETDTGKVQRLKGMWGEVKVAIGNAMMPAVSYAVELATQLMPVIEAITGPMADGLGKAVDYIRQLVGDTSSWSTLTDGIASVWNVIWGFASHVGGVLSDMVLDIVELVKSSTLLRDLFIVIGRIMDFVYMIVGWTVDQIKFLWDEVVMPILEGIEAVWRWLNGIEQKPSKKTVVETKASPETKEANALLADISKNTKTNAQASAEAGKSVVKGGQKVINIHVGKLLDSINFQTSGNMAEAAGDIEEVVLTTLSRVLMQGAANAVG